MITLDRRQLLASMGALMAGAMLPSGLRAQQSSDKKFLFLFNPGGWDPTHALATTFGNPNVSMEPLAQPGVVGDITFVDHPDRPSVRAFFENHGHRALVLNGMMVRSLSHDVCTQLAMTGSSGGDAPDWPTLLSYAQRNAFPMPGLVLGGPSFTGELGVAVARSGMTNQLDQLLSGSILDLSDQPVGRFTPAAERAMDDYLLRRTAARADFAGPGRDSVLTADLHEAVRRASELKELRWDLSFDAAGDFTAQLGLALEALSLGVSRCVTVASPALWDTHVNNTQQSPLWEYVFANLNAVMDALERTPGTSGRPLSEEVVVVVLSEMGRTPMLNQTAGKDHWPYTSALMLGPGIVGGRVVGGFDDNYFGRTIDPGSGDETASGIVPTAENLGATLLALADIDPAPYLPEVQPLSGLLT